jgi:hypothetical protein
MGNDWKCPNCGGMNPEKRNTCLGCNMLNPDLQGGEKRKIQFKEEGGKLLVTFPTICVKCANTKADTVWPVISTYDRAYWGVATTYKRYMFMVPMCTSCKNELLSTSRRGLLVFIFSFIASGLFLYLFSIVKQLSILFLLLAGIFFVVGLVGLYRRMNTPYGSGVASYNEGVFRFTNPEYQRQFDRMNSVVVDN